MASGDIVADIQSIAASSVLTFQPASGVKALITEVGAQAFAGTTPDMTPEATVILTDGSSNIGIRGVQQATQWHPLKLFIDNTYYLRVRNDNASAALIGYSGIEL